MPGRAEVVAKHQGGHGTRLGAQDEGQEQAVGFFVAADVPQLHTRQLGLGAAAAEGVHQAHVHVSALRPRRRLQLLGVAAVG